MNTLLRRGLVILGVSTLRGAAFVPLGDSDWAEGVRAERAAKHGDTSKSESAPPPSLSVVRIVAPVVKEAVLMGVPAGLIILLTMGIRRFRRRSR